MLQINIAFCSFLNHQSANSENNDQFEGLAVFAVDSHILLV